MSGACYYDDCVCGERFHESLLAKHWPHMLADRAAILESERDLLAVLEAIAANTCGVLADVGCGHERIEREWGGCGSVEMARAAIANARKQDAPTGAGGGKQ